METILIIYSLWSFLSKQLASPPEIPSVKSLSISLYERERLAFPPLKKGD